MTRLHQVLPVKKTVAAQAQQALSEARQGLAAAPYLSGQARTYQPKDDEGTQLPPENQKVQILGEEVLALVGVNLTRLFDLEAAIGYANCEARADVKVMNGFVLVPNAPVSYLLFLEKQLEGLAAMIDALPKLDPAQEWTRDEVSGAWKSEPVKTVKSVKTPRNHVKAEATDRHPAQVEIYYEDVPVGTWTTVKLSGAFPANRVRELQERISTLRAAVVHARAEANSVEVPTVHVGKPVMDFLFGA